MKAITDLLGKASLREDAQQWSLPMPFVPHHKGTTNSSDFHGRLLFLHIKEK